jgi:hypothetical protein
MGTMDFIARSAGALVVLLLASTASAQWHDEAASVPYKCWPAYQYQKLGDMQDWDVWKAFSERMYAVQTEADGWSYPPVFPKQEVDNLWRAKFWVKIYCGSFVDVDAVLESQGSFGMPQLVSHLNNVVGDQANMIDPVYGDGNLCRVPVYTPLRLCQIHHLPTNYWDHVFAKTVKGVAPTMFMDMSTMGWTNAITAAGGTNFPAGRTYWTTADYDKGPIPVILNRFFLVQNTYNPEPIVGYWAEWGGTWTRKNGPETNVVQGIGFSTSSWAAAQAIASTNLSDYPWGSLGASGDDFRPWHMYGGEILYTNPVTFHAEWETSRWWWRTWMTGNTNTPSFDWSLCIYYAAATNTGWAGDPSRTVFDANGSTYITTTNHWSLWSQDSGRTLSNASWSAVSFYSTNSFGPGLLDEPNASAEPTVGSAPTLQGWDLDDTGIEHASGHRVVVLMDFRPGFAYRNYAFDALGSEFW